MHCLALSSRLICVSVIRLLRSNNSSEHVAQLNIYLEHRRSVTVLFLLLSERRQQSWWRGNGHSCLNDFALVHYLLDKILAGLRVCQTQRRPVDEAHHFVCDAQLICVARPVVQCVHESQSCELANVAFSGDILQHQVLVRCPRRADRMPEVERRLADRASVLCLYGRLDGLVF